MTIASLTLINGLTFGDILTGTLAIIGIMAIAIFIAMKMINYTRNSLVATETRKLSEKELRRVARDEMKTAFSTREKALQEKETRIQKAAKSIIEATETTATPEEELFGV